MKRLFFSIELPDRIKDKILHCLPALQDSVKYIPEKNWHITVQFIGATPEEEINELISRTEQLQQLKAFTLIIEKIALKKSSHNPMIWAFIKTDNGFDFLSSQIGSLLPKINIKRQIPHINLARLKNQKINFPGVYPKEEIRINCKEFVLMESKLSPLGAEYSVIKRFPFDFETSAK